MSYELHFPAVIGFGRGAADTLPDRLPPDGKLLLVAGRHAAETVIPSLRSRLGRRAVVCFTDLAPELPLDDLERLLEFGRRERVATVAAIGGGSAIDAGKAAAALIPAAGNAADYFFGRRSIPGKGLFFAALPTTSGTGAEMTANAVVRDPATGLKQSIRHPAMLPDLALVDPQLTFGCPPEVTAASGFDALTQAIEATLSRRAVAPTRLLSTGAVDRLFRALPGAMRDEPEARTAMAEGSMQTGMAFAQCGLGAVHGLAHPTGSRRRIPHGVACAILLPSILDFNRESLEPVARQLWNCSADAFRERIEALRRELGLPETFRACGGLSEADIAFAVAHCRSGSMRCNPREMSDAEARAILEALA